MTSHIVFHESFTYKLTFEIANDAASTLMCDDATMFNVLDMFNVKFTQRMKIVDIDDLNHLAIQFAAKWDCEVMIFSTIEDKREQTMQFEAKKFYDTKEIEKFENIAFIDHLMITTTQQIFWSLYLSIMTLLKIIYSLTVFVDDL